jgi:protein-L-isoaspartate(D-aspartate) O-methyltransferase
MTPRRSDNDFAAARQAMVESQLRPEGVSDPVTLAAMASVPREDFVPAEMRPLAYADRPIPLGKGAALPPPAALGQLLNALLPTPGERALVVGPATGYSVAVLKNIGLDVSAADSVEAKHSSKGYDLILLDGAVEAIPKALIAQLREGGRLGGAIADRGITRLVVGRKIGGAFGTRSIGDSAMPMLPTHQAPPAFTF